MGIVNKAMQAVGMAPKEQRIETKVPAQQLERQPETEAASIQIGSDDGTGNAGKGKRSLVRPVASSLGV